MNDEAELLRRYADTGTEDAFAELVRRHLNLTWGAAYRITGDAELARDVAQTVFADLARKAGRLPADTLVPGWLYRAACFAARKVNRGNHRRAAREREAMNDASLPTSIPADATPEVGPLLPRLDEALGTLSQIDRDAVLLRYLSGRSLAEVGTTLGLNEEAARKRVARAVERLRAWFERRGTTATTGLLVAALGTAGAQVAPVGLAATVATASVAGAATIGIVQTLALMKTKIALTTLAVAAVATPLTYQQVALNRTRDENRALRARLEQPAPMEPTPAVPAGVEAATSELERLRAEHLELMRLRGEVGRLRTQAAAAEGMAAELARLRGLATSTHNASRTDPPTPEALEREAQVGIAKLSLLKDWAMAMILYADENEGRLPATLADARHLLPQREQDGSGLNETDLELVAQGRLPDIKDPARTILAREREPWTTARGRSARTYVFADGHSEIYAPPDGDFTRWEGERGIAKP